MRIFHFCQCVFTEQLHIAFNHNKVNKYRDIFINFVLV